MICNIYSVVRFCLLLGASSFVLTSLTIGSPSHVSGLSAPSPRSSSFLALERRTFMNQLPTVIFGVATSNVISTAAIHSVVNAYERRDVGGPDASPETKAMNLQAYETNNRLERDGVKLETAEEQSAKLTAALSDYSYSPSTGKNTKKRK